MLADRFGGTNTAAFDAPREQAMSCCTFSRAVSVLVQQSVAAPRDHSPQDVDAVS